MVKGWRYYNHILFFDIAHIMNLILEKWLNMIFELVKRANFTISTSDYDCPEEQDWWYIVKDDV